MKSLGGRARQYQRVTRRRPRRPPAAVFAPSGVVYAESFDKADGAGWGPDLPWDQSYAGDEATVGGTGTATDAAHPGAANALSRIPLDTLTVDQYMETAVAAISVSDNSWNVDLLLRVTTVVAPETYCACAFQGHAGGTRVVFYRYVAGAFTLMTDSTGHPLLTPGDVLRFEVSGSDLTAKINGATVLAESNGAIPTGTKGGLFVGWGTLGNSVAVDDLEFGDL